MRRTMLFLLLVSMSGFCLAKEPAFAAQLNTLNIDRLQPGGSDAIAGLGDWVLGNGTLCAAISDLKHETGFNPWGGALIDVHHCGKDDDQWPFQHVLPNLDKDKPLEPVLIKAASVGEGAEVTVKSEGHGLEMTSRYRVETKNPRQLQIEHTLVRTARGPSLNMFGVLMLHPHMSLTPYSISSDNLHLNTGFSYPSMDRTDTMSMVNAMIPADTHIMVGTPALGEISYGIQLLDAALIDDAGESRALPVFQQTGPTYSIQGVLSRPPWLGGSGKLGLLEFAQSRLMDIEPGETLRVRQRLLLGARADVASITDQLYQGARLDGRVENDAMVHIRDNRDTPVTVVRPLDDGTFSARLPDTINEVALSAIMLSGQQPAVRARIGNPVLIETENHRRPAVLRLPSRGPMRIIFKGVGETSDPDINDSLLDFRIDGKTIREIQYANYISLAGVPGDPESVSLPPGKYQVVATRGMRYGTSEAVVELAPGDIQTLDIAPPQLEVAARGWLAADLHVHSAPSFDSYIPVDERLRGFAAQGSDVLVASEHNVLVNYQDSLQRAGLAQSLSLVGGVELTGMARTSITPYTNGHINVFPVMARPEAFAGGLIPHEGQRLRQLYHGLKRRYGDVLLQLNHPRLSDPLDPEGDNAYFEHLLHGTAYDSSLPLDSDTNRSLIEADPETGLRDLDFDLIEIANGSSYEGYRRAREDWFSLLAQGEKIFATANSDTHGTRDLVAMPQNFVYLPGAFIEEAFLDALREGHMTGSTGPLLEVAAIKGDSTATGPGGTIRGSSFSLQIIVRAASWVPVDRVTVYLNGESVHEQVISNRSPIEVGMKVESDSFITVEVTGEANDAYSLIAPGFTPYAFSNPIFIDADEDGSWLPVSLATGSQRQEGR